MSEYNDELRQRMLTSAAASIRYGLEHRRVMPIRVEDYPLPLQQLRACFVTLEHQTQLRGCIGNLQAVQPLILDVVHNAYAAAFSDPRFPPLSRTEYPGLELHISILSVPETMPVDSEAELLQQLRPGLDGLILADGPRRATFLPSVWEQLPTAEAFVTQLKRKAGMGVHHWSPTMQVRRYTTESFAAAVNTLA